MPRERLLEEEVLDGCGGDYLPFSTYLLHTEIYILEGIQNPGCCKNHDGHHLLSIVDVDSNSYLKRTSE